MVAHQFWARPWLKCHVTRYFFFGGWEMGQFGSSEIEIYHIISYHIISNRIISHQIASYHIKYISYHIKYISYHIKSHHITSNIFHITSNRIISHQIYFISHLCGWCRCPSKKIHLCECVAKGSRFTFGGLGVDTCSRDPAFGVRNRPCAAVVRIKLPCLWEKPQERVFLNVSEDVLS